MDTDLVDVMRKEFKEAEDQFDDLGFQETENEQDLANKYQSSIRRTRITRRNGER